MVRLLPGSLSRLGEGQGEGDQDELINFDRHNSLDLLVLNADGLWLSYRLRMSLARGRGVERTALDRCLFGENNRALILEPTEEHDTNG